MLCYVGIHCFSVTLVLSFILSGTSWSCSRKIGVQVVNATKIPICFCIHKQVTRIQS